MKIANLFPTILTCTAIVGIVLGILLSFRYYTQNKGNCNSKEELDELFKQSVLCFFICVISSMVACFLLFLVLESYVIWLLLVMAIIVFL